MALPGTTMAGAPDDTMISPVANDPGRMAADSLATWASMRSDRLCSSIAGLTRTTRPAYAVTSPSTRTLTCCPTLTLLASRSGTSACRRSGCMRTSVAIGAPALTYWPGDTVRSRMMPANGAIRIESLISCRA